MPRKYKRCLKDIRKKNRSSKKKYNPYAICAPLRYGSGAVHTGPKGGRYIVLASGHKKYLPVGGSLPRHVVHPDQFKMGVSLGPMDPVKLF